jgi:hypothetical protein
VSTAQYEARQSRTYDIAITVGLIAYGVIHLLIAWLALQLAWGESSQEASEHGALAELAGKPLGGVLLWTIAIGLFALVVWQALLLAYVELKPDRLASSAGRAVAYLGLGAVAVKVALGDGGSGSGQQRTISARLMEHGLGRALVVAIGVGIVAIGAYHIYKSITTKFREDLVGGVSDLTIALGRIGFAAKGVAFMAVGALFGWARSTTTRRRPAVWTRRCGRSRSSRSDPSCSPSWRSASPPSACTPSPGPATPSTDANRWSPDRHVPAT